MTFEEASDMFAMHSISPDLTCQCDEELQVLCQQCMEDESNLYAFENQTYEG
jgi:hypothetical protein